MKTQKLFKRISQDEKYHVSYTGKILDRWRAEGREREVEEALKEARRSRFFGAWKRLGVRSGAGFGKAVMFVFYWTLLLPMGLLSRGRKNSVGWQKPRDLGTPQDAISSQY